MKPLLEVTALCKDYTIYNSIGGGSKTFVETLASFFRGRQKATREIFSALRDVNFTLEQGDRLGIIGSNGAGKSTLLKILSRITEPTRGRVAIRGRVASLLEVGTGFHPELTGRENIFLNGAILGMTSKEIRAKFDEIVDFAGVEKFLDTPVKRYSSGMFTRLGFSVAAHLDPDLLIVDEVLAVGDQTFQEKCLKKLDDLGRSGRTVIFVSHDMGNVVSLCNKGLWLQEGALKAQGPVEEVVSGYLKTLKDRSLSWEGDFGDEHIRFKKFFLTGNKSGEYFTSGDNPLLHLEYQVTRHDPDLLFGFSVLNQRSQIIARSHTADNPELMGRFNAVGSHKVSFPFPAKLFNEGEYYIRLECVIHDKKPILRDELFLKFPLFTPEKGTRYQHLSKMGGVYLGDHWTFS